MVCSLEGLMESNGMHAWHVCTCNKQVYDFQRSSPSSNAIIKYVTTFTFFITVLYYSSDTDCLFRNQLYAHLSQYFISCQMSLCK